ncbi:MAG: ATP-binding protein, partial [Polyangia bacterium]
MTRAAAATLAVAVALGAGCARHGHGTLDAAHALADAAQKRLAPLDADGRRRALASARIFEPVDVAARDLYAGPRDPYAARFG